MPLSMTILLVTVALALLSMAVYAGRGVAGDADARSKNAQFLGGFGDFVLYWFLWVVDPLARVSIRLRLGPDFYNFAGLALGALAGLAVGFGRLELAGWALALSGVCDILDGRIARAQHVTSAYGAFIDSALDRFIELFVFMGFAVFARDMRFGALAATLAVGASLIVSYTRAIGEAQGVECTGGLMQRGERLALLSLACLFDGSISTPLGLARGSVLLPMTGLIGVFSLVTAVHRTVWIARRLRAPRAPLQGGGERTGSVTRGAA